jgi:hypothetical protein
MTLAGRPLVVERIGPPARKFGVALRVGPGWTGDSTAANCRIVAW